MDGSSSPAPLEDAPLGSVEQATAQSLVNKTIAGRYEILEMVGEGPLLAAYRARDRELNRIVSLKTPLPAWSARADVSARLRDGVSQVLAFSHPNITRAFDLGEDAERNGVVFVAEEYVRGIDLQERIRRVAPFQLTAANEVALALAEALEYAHARETAHGDVRPQNALIGPENQIKLTNFGVARAQNLLALDNPDLLRRAQPYRAPELTRGGDEAATFSADLFALGAILFEMLTGDTPAHGGADAPSPRETNQTVPRALDGIVRKALAPTPHARYVSASDMARDLRLVRDALRFGKPLAWSPLDAPLPPVLVASPLTDVPLASVTSPVAAPPLPDLATLSPPVPAPPRVPLPPPPVFDADTTNVMPGTGAAARRVAPVAEVIPTPLPLAPETIAAATIAAPVAATGATAVYADPPETLPPTTPLTRGKADRRNRRPKREDDLTFDENEDYKPPRASNAGKWLVFINLFLTLVTLGAIAAVAYITFNLLQPPREVVVPNLVGKSLSEARSLAHEQAFSLATVDRQFRDKEADDVIFQMNPQAGRHIRAGKPVSIWVSNGPKMVEVPDVRDIGLDKGRRILEKNGLRLGELRYEYDITVTKGNIASQLPEWGENRPRGTRIDLVVSKGEEPPPPPLPEPSPFPVEPDTVGEVDSQGDKVRVIGITGYQVPDDGATHRLRIDVEDKNGRRTVFDENREAGEKFSQDVECIGKRVTVILYDNDTEKATKTQTFKD